MVKKLIVIFFIFPLVLKSQSPFGVNLQSTSSLNSGNQNIIQTRNRVSFSYLYSDKDKKEKRIKNYLNGRYDYGEVNKKKNMSEVYLGVFSKFYFKEKWRALAVAEKESSYMRAIKKRELIGTGLGYDTKSGLNLSLMGFHETTEWETRRLEIFRISFRLETEHKIGKKGSLTTQFFLQPDLNFKYSRASGNATCSIEVFKKISLTSSLTTSYEQWVPKNKKKEDLALTLGVLYKIG